MLWYLSLITVASLPVWHDDALVAARERASKAYSSLAYFFAVMLHELVLLRIVPPLFFLAAYGKIRLNDAPGSRWRFVLVLILANVGSTAMTLLLGLCASKVTTANVLGVLVMLLNCLFGGYMLSNKDLPALVDLVGNLFPNKHAYEMLVLNEFEGVDGFAFTATVHREVQRRPVDGDLILSTFGFVAGRWERDLLALLALIAACMGMSYLLLKFAWTLT